MEATETQTGIDPLHQTALDWLINYQKKYDKDYVKYRDDNFGPQYSSFVFTGNTIYAKIPMMGSSTGACFIKFTKKRTVIHISNDNFYDKLHEVAKRYSRPSDPKLSSHTNKVIEYQNDEQFDVMVHEVFKAIRNSNVEEIKPISKEEQERTYYNVFPQKNTQPINKSDIDEYCSLLRSNYNLVLTGAPGTGKSFLANEIATKMVGIGTPYSNYDKWKTEEKDKLKKQVKFVQFHPSYDYTDFVEGLRPKKSADGFEYKLGVFKEFCKNAKQDKDENNPYVFIIDEINRGELSKIFGELFFAIDPGYRGEKGKVETQYQNLIDSNETFSDGFYIPKNVYIIGTMNDIDRSVESMDFAMRRRFVWKEIKPEDRISMWGDANWAKKALGVMNALNKKICEIPSLGSAYQIGPAYFKKLEEYNGNFDNLWNYHISIILKEYLRGNSQSEILMEEFKSVYDNAKQQIDK